MHICFHSAKNRVTRHTVFPPSFASIAFDDQTPMLEQYAPIQYAQLGSVVYALGSHKEAKSTFPPLFPTHSHWQPQYIVLSLMILICINLRFT